MSVPPQGALHRPILEIAVETSGTHSIKEYIEFISQRLSLTAEDLAERVSTGLPRVRVNIGFALHLLKEAGLLDRPSRGHFRVTPSGRNFLNSHTGKITTAQLKKLSELHGPEDVDTSSGSIVIDETTDEDASPQDKIEVGYRELTGQLADDLLESIVQVSPDAFERLVVDLLEKMGYGKGEAVGRSGDGGIDGIINQDALGLEKVYIQAKRWKDAIVGSNEITGFAGSLDMRGATKGVFVTTSRFTENAKKTATTISSGNKFIRLIDGPELAKLMLNHDVGVITTYTYKIQALDENYFAEEL